MIRICCMRKSIFSKQEEDEGEEGGEGRKKNLVVSGISS